MRLSPSTKLGRYEVLAYLGAGGVGEVYRARDTSLGREVAIKVLQRQQPEALARFKREARLLASLSHPGIAAIHGLEEYEGAHFLVMELVPGETLAERIARGPIPPREVLALFLQIAEALEAAHAKGIVHRDLKPANVKITPEGGVKLLDFGLAKVFVGEELAAEVSESPTVTRGTTRDGRILGTPAYLSPEQARGKPIDHRTDVWAFGCVLYEALSGETLFLRETVSDTIAGILDREPDWDALPHQTPSAARRLLRRCLDKDVRRRLQTIGDARIEIEELLEGRGEEPVVPPGELASEKFSWSRVSPWLVGVLALILAGLGVHYARRADPPREVSVRLALNLPSEAPLAPPASMPLGYGRPGLALSPDGRWLVYVAQVGSRTQLLSRDMTTAEIKPIPGTEGAHGPFVSPDGEWVAFYADGKLKKVAPSSGELVVLSEASGPFGGCWGDDDVIYFVTNEGDGISRIAAGGGDVELVVAGQYLWPEILPFQKGLLYSDLRGGIYLKKAEGIERISSEGTFPRYVPTGHLLYAEPGKLLAARFDVSSLTIKGPSVTLLHDLRTDVFGGAQFTISRNGTIVYLSGADSRVASLVWVDRSGKIEPLGLPPAVYGAFDISPDGTELAIGVFDGSSADIWLYDISRGTRTRLTFASRAGIPIVNLNPRWTPDGKHVVYTSLPEVRPQLFWKPADGSREAAPLVADDAPLRMNPSSFSPDGSILAFYATTPETGMDLWTLSLEGIDPERGTRAKPQPFLQTRFQENFPRFSPDGRWIAYASNEGGRRDVYVRSFPGAGSKIQISNEGGTEPSWHPNGRELFYQLGNRWYAAEVILSPEFKAERPRLLFEGPFIDIPGFAYALAPDGERFLVLENREQFEPRTDLTVLTSFFEVLQERVPSSEN